ncbi:hypothetical protein [Rhodococcus koreensis]
MVDSAANEMKRVVEFDELEIGRARDSGSLDPKTLRVETLMSTDENSSDRRCGNTPICRPVLGCGWITLIGTETAGQIQNLTGFRCLDQTIHPRALSRVTAHVPIISHRDEPRIIIDTVPPQLGSMCVLLTIR